MIPPDEDPHQLRKDLEQQADDDDWADLYDRIHDSIEAIKETPINEMETADLLILAHSLILPTLEYKDYDDDLELAKQYVYEAWKRVVSMESR